MFDRLGVPILGVIESMSYYVCPHCGETTAILGADGGKKTSEKLGVSFLGQIPIDPEICTGGDLGVPIVASNPDSPQSIAFRSAADLLVEQISNQGPQSELKII